MARERRAGRAALIAVVLLGIGLIAAPAIFQMFTRAPKGGRMISDFRPYVTHGTIAQFRGYLAEIDAAEREAGELAEAPDRAVAEWRLRWPDINADMLGMLRTIETNIGRYRGVAALPPFPLFPWFFVAPGVILVVLGAVALRSARRRPAVVAAMAIVGLGLVAAPAVFQMFTRAPGGARMIDDFRPMMTTANVTDVQRSFLAIAAAEAELRTVVLPASADDALPAIRRFSADWPRISRDMAPMIGAMSDNVDSFAAVDALPPFWLFPWFFVLPGLVAAGLALAAWPRTHPSGASTDGAPERAIVDGRAG